MKEKWEYSSKYLIFYFTKGFDISFEICGYFDNRPRINIQLFFFRLTLILPFRNKWTDECDCPKWGISWYHSTLWFHLGGKGNMNGGSKWYTIHAPWDWDWVRTSYLRKDGTWENESKGNRKDFYKDHWDEVLWSEKYPYTYTLKSGEVQNRIAKVRVEEMEWRWHWFKWLDFGSKKRRSIDIDFDGEVGEGTGSWKGGTVGCGYDLREGETPLESLRRMEKDRKFNR